MTTLPGDFVLHDISAEGRVLLGRISESSEIQADLPGEAHPRNLSYLDRSVAVGLAPSGDTLLFNEMGQGGQSVYLRRTDGSPPNDWPAAMRGSSRRTENSSSPPSVRTLR